MIINVPLIHLSFRIKYCLYTDTNRQNIIKHPILLYAAALNLHVRGRGLGRKKNPTKLITSRKYLICSKKKKTHKANKKYLTITIDSG